MKKCLAGLLAAWLAFMPIMAMAAVGTVFVDTGGAATNSGTTNTASPTISGTAAVWTTATNAITLDVNTNISTVSGCSAGTCDGSQAIFLTNATNASTKIFWLASYTGCTGTGACVVTVSGTPTSPTCTTCTVQNWSIGGQYIWPTGGTNNLIAGALRGGDTVQWNQTPAGGAKTTTFFNAITAGDTTNGCVRLTGATGTRPLLQTTGNSNVLQLNQANYCASNLELNASVTGNALAISASGAAIIVDNVKVSSGGTISAVSLSGAGSSLTNSEVAGSGGDGIGPGPQYIAGNYIHGNAGAGINASTTSPNYTIDGNLIVNNTGRAIYQSGTVSSTSNKLIVIGNTIDGNGGVGLEINSANTVAMIRNNIIRSTTTGVNTIKWDSGNGQLVSQHGYNVLWNSVDSSSSVTGYTLSSTETGADPKFVAPASNNWAIQNTSPAAGAGYISAGTLLPWGGIATTGYRDIGAAQRQVPASTGSAGIIGGGL